MFDHPILVTGATGKVGSRVVSRLTDSGRLVRAVSRRSEPRFDWTEPETWPAVLSGVRSIFVSFYPDLAMPGAEGIIDRFAACAKESGATHLVLLSGRGEKGAQSCESILQNSGLRCSVVRCSWFFQNFTEGMLRQAVIEGTLALPAGEVVEPFVDVDDIADVAVAALLGAVPDAVYDVTGPRLLTFFEVAEELSKAAGRSVTYVPLNANDFRAALTQTAGPELAELFTAICSEVFSGQNQWLGSGVQQALGREPRDFTDFCLNAANSEAWGS